MGTPKFQRTKPLIAPVHPDFLSGKFHDSGSWSVIQNWAVVRSPAQSYTFGGIYRKLNPKKLKTPEGATFPPADFPPLGQPKVKPRAPGQTREQQAPLFGLTERATEFPAKSKADQRPAGKSQPNPKLIHLRVAFVCWRFPQIQS